MIDAAVIAPAEAGGTAPSPRSDPWAAASIPAPRRQRFDRAPWRWLRQPLLQFLLIGGAAFLLFPGGGEQDKAGAPIVVDAALRGRLAALYRVQMGTDPPPPELRHLADTYVRDEVLYREALRLGLEHDDEIIRRRLIQKMEFIAQQAPTEPSEKDLQRYFSSHRADFAQPTEASFSHLFFSPDRDGWATARARAEQALRAPAAPSPLTDPFPLQSAYARLAPADAQQLFGTTEFARAPFESPIGRWVGPLRSGYGWHLLLVTGRTQPTPASLDAVRPAVLAAWQSDAAGRGMDAAVAEMASRYRIVRDNGGEGR